MGLAFGKLAELFSANHPELFKCGCATPESHRARLDGRGTC
jgi:hypothetical protein